MAWASREWLAINERISAARERMKAEGGVEGGRAESMRAREAAEKAAHERTHAGKSWLFRGVTSERLRNAQQPQRLGSEEYGT